MNRITLQLMGIENISWTNKLIDFAELVLKRLDCINWDLSLLLCNDNFIQDLNKNYRNIDEATDVLSFTLGEKFIDEELGERWVAGDIVISLETLKKIATILMLQKMKNCVDCLFTAYYI